MSADTKWYVKDLVILKQFAFMLDLGFMLVKIIALGERHE